MPLITTTTAALLQACYRLFGYDKGELDGKNVSVLMPPPFNQRHSSYMQRYVATGEPHILDRMNELLAAHKAHHVFPVSLGLLKMSGTGADSVFLGVIKAQPPAEDCVRMWIMPGGQVGVGPVAQLLGRLLQCPAAAQLECLRCCNLLLCSTASGCKTAIMCGYLPSTCTQLSGQAM